MTSKKPYKPLYAYEDTHEDVMEIRSIINDRNPHQHYTVDDTLDLLIKVWHFHESRDEFTDIV